MSKVYIGTSGFNYGHWADGVFYPQGLAAAKWLSFYASKFNSVELNVTFYRLPERSTFEKWYKETPDNFVFAIKGSRFITHVKKLNNANDSVKLFFDNAAGLGQKLKIVLWQFGANFKINLERFGSFCDLLRKNKIAKNLSHAFEFRHESWFRDEVYGILKKHNFALCIAHSRAWPSEEVVTANYVYLRFHGGKILFTSNYSKKELVAWASKIKKWMGEGKDVYAYFNNDAMGFAPKNALTLHNLVLSRSAKVIHSRSVLA